jgi:hypothetical protein
VADKPSEAEANKADEAKADEADGPMIPQGR